MVVDDPYGIYREERIKRSGIRDVFTPNSPVLSVELFSGLKDEVSKIIECLNTKGQHILLYGDRGVGKSSLARISCLVLNSAGIADGQLYQKRCDSHDTFKSIVVPILESVGIDFNTISYESENNFGIDKVFCANKKSTIRTEGNAVNSLSPSWVVDKIKDIRGILLIDEFDVIANEIEKKKIAEMIKLLSDCGSALTIFIVGIAETANILMGGHPSVSRCLKEIKLGRMNREELNEIIRKGEERAGIIYDAAVKRRIVTLSSGYAYYTHLLALKAAEEAIASDRKNVTINDLRVAMQKAAGDAEGSLKQAYDNAVRSSRKDEFKKIVIAAALCGDDEFKAVDLRTQYQKYTGKSISQNELNNYFAKLISRDDSCILKRLGTGVYRFTDPRMSSYVRIANNLTQSI